MKTVVAARALMISLLILLAAAQLAAQASSLVDVGGYRLDVVQAGTGDPAVVLVAGLGNDVDTWKTFLPYAAKLGTVVAYSRAGLGRSEGATREHTVSSSVDELHRLIEKLGLKRPVVLVGASYGGIIVRLYTSRYPADVAGLVFIDASSEEQVKRYGKLDPTYPGAFKKVFEDLIKTQTGAVAGETRESLRIQMVGVVEGMKPVPDLPMAVLTSMQPDPKAQYVNQTPRGYDEWRAMHDEWFLRSSNAIHITTSHSGHHIQDDEPQLVADAIRFVLDRVTQVRK